MDKNVYINQLEDRLEQAAAGCMEVQGFTQRMDLLSGQVGSVEERIVSLTRLIKLLQTNDESHEQDMTKLSEIVNQLIHKTELPSKISDFPKIVN